MSSARALNLSISLVNIRRQGRSHKKKPGGSWPGRSPNVERDHVAAYNQLSKMYIGERFMYTDEQTLLGKKVYILL
ncbi:hypothetical protein F442_20006 [Phytophthora nicotianae P10297]|uniref:Uncharacterized protein n=1 Tax=Phytophthora nicotianae P10297 TaxID=1317064 RepID=W2Y8R6_PHYNI|nr:hypothetical protein F442_20006 [Phytophthora nicotianae P10297]